MVKIGRQEKSTQYLSFCRFRQMANVGGKVYCSGQSHSGMANNDVVLQEDQACDESETGGNEWYFHWYYMGHRPRQ